MTLTATSSHALSATVTPAVSGAHPAKGSSAARPRKNSLWPGLFLSVAIALVAEFAGRALPIIGGPVFGILLGIVYRSAFGLHATLQPGISFSSKKILQVSIVLLGFGLSFTQIMATGGESLAVTLVTVTVAFVSAWLLGRLLRTPSDLTTLIGVGTAICGGSAIAAVTPILKPSEHDTAFAISTIFLFNIVAVLTFPALGHMLGLSDYGFGMWAGTAINDTSSVVAAGYAYSHAAGDFATIVKLTRATLIIPICLFLVVLVGMRNRRQGNQSVSLAKIFPWFIVWFLLASLTRSTGIVPEIMLDWINVAAKFLIVVALVAVGVSADMRKIFATGPRPILLGFLVWMAVSVSSLIVQYAMGQM